MILYLSPLLLFFLIYFSALTALLLDVLLNKALSTFLSYFLTSSPLLLNNCSFSIIIFTTIHSFNALGSSTGVASVKLSLIWNKICSHPDNNYVTMKDFEDDGKYCKYFCTCSAFVSVCNDDISTLSNNHSITFLYDCMVVFLHTYT